MKIGKFFALLLVLFILNSTFSTNLIIKTSQDDNKLLNYICKITKDIIKSKTDTQDVLIGILGGKMWSSTVNDIAGCVGTDSAVVVSDFNDAFTDKTLRKPAIVILMFGEIFDQTKLSMIIERLVTSTIFNIAAPIVCLVSSTADLNQQMMIIDRLLFYSILNFVILFEERQKIKILSINPFTGDVVITDKLISGHEMFPDKLKNLHGFSYRIPVCAQYPRVIVEETQIRSNLNFFMAAVAHIQNADFRMFFFGNCEDILTLWRRRSMELTFNTIITFTEYYDQKLMTYEENGYCALVPLPPKIPIVQSIFIEPFDGLTWLFFVITMACCVAVFWMFRSRGAVDSPWLLGYGMFIMFIGQGVEFSRKNRRVLVILLQLIIVMIWILNQAYEGVITSFMIQPIHEHRLETFDDLVASDYDIACDQVFEYKIKQAEIYKSLGTRLEASKSLLGEKFESEVLRQHYVFVLECDQAQNNMNLMLESGRKLSDYYYLLLQKSFPHLVRLETSFLNPFIERLQYYMDLSFQAGLPHMWNVFMSPAYFDQYQVSQASPSVIYLKDLGQVFGILLFGCLLSVVVLLIEICCHGILQNLKLINPALKLRNRVHQMAYKKRKQGRHPKYQEGALYYIIHRHKRVKRLKARKLKVRTIYVQPRFPMD